MDNTINQMLVNKNFIKGNPLIKKIQKEFLHLTRKPKSKNVKAKIGKFVKLHQDCSSFIDLTNSTLENTNSNLSSLDTYEKIISFIKDKKIIGLSGSCFELASKLESVFSDGNKNLEKTLVINAVECEPSLIHDEWLLKNKTNEIEKAISILTQCGFSKAIIASNSSIILNQIGPYEIKHVASRYPMGSEKILLKEILDITLNDDEFPTAKGIAVVNVQTLLSFYQSVLSNSSPNSRYITVADFTLSDKKQIKNGNAFVVNVPYGKSIKEVVENVLGKTNESELIVSGGGLFLGHQISSEESIQPSTCFIGKINSVVQFNNENK